MIQLVKTKMNWGTAKHIQILTIILWHGFDWILIYSNIVKRKKCFNWTPVKSAVISNENNLSFWQSKFGSFYQYAKSFNSDSFDYEGLKTTDYVFMRWKEHFLVPDHTIKDINGASFAGFYYICFQKSAATIEGYYYHRSSEWYV